MEYIFAVNSDDPTAKQILGNGSMVVADNFKGSAPAWDAAASASSGEILIQMQDDLELPDRWDVDLLHMIVSRGGMDWPFKPLVVAVGDGYRHDGLLCTAICNRARYVQQGEFLHKEYLSVFSDDEFSVRAYADAADGLCTLVRAADLVFKHEHPYHTKSVEIDDTYRRENSPEAYRVGASLFAERNKRQVDRGFRTWG